MDASMMDAEGGRVHHLERRAKRLAVIVALQNLLVAACLLLTLYAYCVQEPVFEDNIHIHFAAIADITGNMTLEFGGVQSRHKMSLFDEKNDTIYINCTGPYILYMDVCYMSMMKGKEAKGTLQLVDGSRTPPISFLMKSSLEVCTVLQETVYLREKGKASLRLESTVGFKIKNVTVGLSNLLGRRCQF